MRGLVLLFILLPILIYLAIFFLIPSKTGHNIYPLTSHFNLLFTLIWHIALSSAYIMTYPSIQTGCPSLQIVNAVHASMPGGLTFEEIHQRFAANSLFAERFEDLVKDGLITLKYDAWGITFTGRLLSRFFITYRQVLKLPLGEG